MASGQSSADKDAVIRDLQRQVATLQQQVAHQKSASATECFEDFQRTYAALEETVKSSGASAEKQAHMMHHTKDLLTMYNTLTADCYSKIEKVRQEWNDAWGDALQALRKVDSIKKKGLRATQHITSNMAGMKKALEEDDEESVISFSELVQENVAKLVEQIEQVTNVLTTLEEKVNELAEKVRQDKASDFQRLDNAIADIRGTRDVLAGLAGVGKSLGRFVGLVSICIVGGAALGIGGGMAAVALQPALAAFAAAAPATAGALAVAGQVALGAGAVTEAGVAVYGLSCAPEAIRKTYREHQDKALVAASRAFEERRRHVQQEYRELEQGLEAGASVISMGKENLSSLRTDAEEAEAKASEIQTLAEERRDLRTKLKPQSHVLRRQFEQTHEDLLENLEGLHAAGAALGNPERLNLIGKMQGDSGRQITGRGLRILCIDGGGAKGVVPARILEEIESRMGKPLRECFDLVCGTSTGGLLALLLTYTELSASEIRRIYEQDGRSIFSDKSSIRMLLQGHKYTKGGLEGLVRRHVGDARMDSVQRPCCFVTATVDDTSEMVFLFRNYGQGARSWVGTDQCRVLDAARATTAAPTYLPEVRLPVPSTNREHVFKDGGLTFNNPVGAGLQEALELWTDQEIGCLVSLGCGRGEPLRMNSGLWSFLTGELPEIATSTEKAHRQLENLVRGGKVQGQQECLRYFRLNPELKDAAGQPIKMDIDSVDPASIDKLVDMAEHFIATEPIQPIQFAGGAAGSEVATPLAPLASPQCELYNALR